jgi:hypothetical protein
MFPRPFFSRFLAPLRGRLPAGSPSQPCRIREAWDHPGQISNLQKFWKHIRFTKEVQPRIKEVQPEINQVHPEIKEVLRKRFHVRRFRKDVRRIKIPYIPKIIPFLQITKDVLPLLMDVVPKRLEVFSFLISGRGSWLKATAGSAISPYRWGDSQGNWLAAGCFAFAFRSPKTGLLPTPS